MSIEHGELTRRAAAQLVSTTPQPEPPAGAGKRAGAKLRALLPWGSFALGIAGAFTMDRGPERGALIAGAAVLLWLALIALQWLVRAGREAEGKRVLLIAARWSSLLAAQSLVQLAFFFALPFYFQAATFDPGHALFLLGLCALSAASLWDPLTEWLLQHPLVAPVLPAIASFAALDAVLPGLGLSTRASLWTAAFVAGLGATATSIASVPRERRARVAAIAVPAALLIPLALGLGAARIVPAAPLRLMKIEIGTQRAGRWVSDPMARLEQAPARLYCATAIYSPLGVKDRLFHVWTRDGEQRARVELDIRGGRPGGYRTFSRIGPFGKHATGVYRCRVETLAGQVLGSARVRIGAR